MIKVETNIYDKFQTVVPKKIRETMGLTKNHIIEWTINDKGKVELSFRKKVTDDDVIGMVSLKEKTNAVKLVEDLYKKGDKKS
ncbi:MAG: putative regulator PrlF [Methanobacterium sp. PtaU1.Bin097]|nr:MAG: putative regulator PrlF [Methanobacterium sp. PtaU1.Bin097]